MGKKNGRLFLNIPDEFFDKAREALAPQLEAKAREVAASVDGKTGVLVRKDRKGRPVALVTLMEPDGVRRQVREGVLTRAAAQAGLDVRRYTAKEGGG